MRLDLGLLTAVGIVVLVACSTVTVSFDYDTSANFDGLHTYDWFAGLEQNTGDLRVDNPWLVSRIRNAVERELADKGYQRNFTAPDFYVSSQAAIEGKISVETYETPVRHGPRGGWAGWGGTYTEVRQYEEGTLVLDILSGKTGALIWRGTGKAEVHQEQSAAKRTETINGAVRQILTNFPPGRKEGSE
jgi:hypothetical protein